MSQEHSLYKHPKTSKLYPKCFSPQHIARTLVSCLLVQLSLAPHTCPPNKPHTWLKHSHPSSESCSLHYTASTFELRPLVSVLDWVIVQSKNRKRNLYRAWMIYTLLEL